MEKKRILAAITCVAAVIPGFAVEAQEARARAEMLDLIQREKFDVVLPGVMRDNGVDMWIHVIRDGDPDALALDLRGTAEAPTSPTVCTAFISANFSRHSSQSAT